MNEREIATEIMLNNFKISPFKIQHEEIIVITVASSSNYRMVI